MQSVKAGVSGGVTKLGQYITKISTAEESKVDLDQFLKKNSVANDPMVLQHFIITDDEDGESIKIDEEKKEEVVLPIQAEEVTSNLDNLIEKRNRIELKQMEELGIKLVATRKEVKNASIVRNFISSYEDRYVAIIQIGNEL